MLFNRIHADLTQSLNSFQSAILGPSLISADLIMVGTISAGGEIQLDGKVLGDLHILRLIVGHTGRVEGDVFAEHVEVRGHLVGNVSARTVFVTSTGRVDGNLLVENLTIEPGGHFDGNCGRTDSCSKSFATVATDQTSITREAGPTEAAQEKTVASATAA